MALFDFLKPNKGPHDQFPRECKEKIQRIRFTIDKKHNDSSSIMYVLIKKNFDDVIKKLETRPTALAAKGKVDKNLNSKIEMILDKLEAISKYDSLEIVDIMSYLTKVLIGFMNVYNGATTKNAILDDKMQAEIFEKTIEAQLEYLSIAEEVAKLEEEIESVKDHIRLNNPSQADLQRCKNIILDRRKQIDEFEKQINMTSRALDQLLQAAGSLSTADVAKRAQQNVTIKDFGKRMHENTKIIEDLYDKFEENQNIMDDFNKVVEEQQTKDKNNSSTKKKQDIEIKMAEEAFEEPQQLAAEDILNL